MDTIINYFADIPSSHRTLIIVVGLTLFSLIESALPLMELTYNRWKHAKVNLFFTLTTILVNFVLAFILVMSSEWAVTNGFGLLSMVAWPIWIKLIVGLMLMDFLGAWLAHWVQHHVKWMWRFHAVHHTDQHIDATSANRHHPGESVIRFIFTIGATIIVGAPLWLVFLYQSMSIVLSQFNHANIVFPLWFDKLFVSVFCSPNMHHVHHHYRMPYSDTNYGNIFSIWDRIFQTYARVDNSKLVYGLDTHMTEKENKNIGHMLKLPFLPYKGHIKYDEVEKL